MQSLQADGQQVLVQKDLAAQVERLPLPGLECTGPQVPGRDLIADSLGLGLDLLDDGIPDGPDSVPVQSVPKQVHATWPGLGRPLDGPTRLFTGLVYKSIRGVTQLVGASIDVALAQLAPLLGESVPGPEREAMLANGPGHGCGHNLLGTASAFAAIAAKMARANPRRVGAIAGDLAGVEEIFALKDLMTRLGVVNLDCRQDGAAFDPSWGRASYLFNSTIVGIESADALLLVGTNPRREAAVLNARIRKHWRTSAH